MIFKFLLFIFFFIVFMVILFGVSFLRLLRNLFFGSPGRKSARQRTSAQSAPEAEQKQPTRQREKIIPKDVGEYVDYEEVKD